MSDNKPKIIKGAGASIPELPPSDPIYTRGFVVGMKRVPTKLPIRNH